MGLLDDVFELLETARRLEKTQKDRIEAATKYYEAVYLMRQLLQHTPQTRQNAATRALLEEKIQFYSDTASRLYFDDTSTVQSVLEKARELDPRSPLTVASHQFFTEQVSVVPSPPPVAVDSPSLVTQSGEINKRASRANNTLVQAIDLDESGKTKQAVDMYMQVAEQYLATIRLCEERGGPSSASIADTLKRRLEGALDRVEQLKHPNRKTAVKSKQDNTKEAAYSKEEIEVLKRSSLIASGLFLPWSEDEALALSHHVQHNRQQTVLFTDPDGFLTLSDKQKQRFHRWARPSEIATMRSRFVPKQQQPTMIRSVNPYSIQQKFVTDCSFIASLCICAAFEQRFRKKLITSIIYPQNKEGIPTYNPEGKYMVKLWLNGVARQIIVDDKLPIDKNSNILCSQTTGSKHQIELWVTIIEKAYMKLCGGYDFPGSNSGVDLFSLTGWIPERIFFPRNQNRIRDFETPPERAWERLFSANSFGDCLITVSTNSEMTEEKAMGLVTGHAYAVLDVFEAKNGTRLLQLKNPWASKRWKGKYSSIDLTSWKQGSLCTEVGYDPELASQHDDGIFWISWTDMLVHFQNVHLSWNPGLFSHRVTTHKIWPGNQGPQNDTFNIGENPQYVMTISNSAILKNATVWVIVSRHVTKQEQEGAEVNDFLTIHVARNNGDKERIWYPHGHHILVNGAYSNNPHVLARYDIGGEKDKYLSLILSQYDRKNQDLGYTINCFCTEPFSLGPPQKELPFVHEVAGAWSEASAGGQVGKDGWFRNPMYVLRLDKDTTLQLRCSTKRTFAVNVMLVGIPATTSDHRQLVQSHGKPLLDSGNYRHGFSVTQRRIFGAGVYVMVVSTYNEGELGVFSARIASSIRIALEIVR